MHPASHSLPMEINECESAGRTRFDGEYAFGGSRVGDVLAIGHCDLNGSIGLDVWIGFKWEGGGHEMFRCSHVGNDLLLVWFSAGLQTFVRIFSKKRVFG